MAEDVFDKYLSEINKAYLRDDATEHTHRPALKKLIEALGDKITATNEPRQIGVGTREEYTQKFRGSAGDDWKRNCHECGKVV